MTICTIDRRNAEERERKKLLLILNMNINFDLSKISGFLLNKNVDGPMS